MNLFKSASNAGRDRPGRPQPRSNIRGKISGPIPIPDDEFPLRTSDPPVAEEAVPEHVEPAAPALRDSGAESTNTGSNATREEKTDSIAQSGPSQASMTSNPIQRRTNRSSVVRYSHLSEATDSASPSRKKSSFRLAISKLFGKRNRKRNSRSQSDSEAQLRPSHDPHHSSPVARKRSLSDPESEPKRSASLPITEFNKALRSHSIGPDDYIAIHSARNSLQSDSAFLRRRAVTTSGGPISSRLRDDGMDILGLTPRPASTHGNDMGHEHDPESIGRAVSVDIFPARRRSRSLSQLQDVSEEHGLVRKRSEEIRYWRASSIGLLSPDLSVSQNEDPETTDATEPTTETNEEVAQPIRTPPQPFNFGPLHTMKITQAASLEDRVATLEVQNQKLEKLVSQLFHVVSGIDSEALSPTAPFASHHRTSSTAVQTSSHHNLPPDAGPIPSGYSVSEQSNVSFEDEQTFIGSVHPSTREAPRPISNVTVRGAASLVRDPSGAFTPEYANTLQVMLDTERAARHALELRVTKLSHTIDMMSLAMDKLGANPPAPMNISVFDHDDDDDDDDDMGPPSASIDDDSEAFKTPHEEQPVHDYGLFGDDVPDEADDGSRKRAARAISLGQLTLGKPRLSPQPGAGVDL
ncbi:hypothetical protein F5B22DRAFT_648663 [Xylaria bambusicola]|uniref:uncharacterized protein n=1 Tax=Xylaria bambusicola TaxID=326684 RepID=UPI002007935B|nr:uncharacterized protein F5B22DRAFT_648663 [Xylaria bambusicola]KAI0512560.1 hypothetical protein F5B22DRAFT_648663 [Xylaria bambusicola]